MRLFRGVSNTLWAPLIDGTYAIVLTLLVIEVPSLSIDIVREFNHNAIGVSSLAASISGLIIGYLGVFLILFDIWSKKRRLLAVSEKHFVASSFENAMILVSLFLATLMPPFFNLAWRVRQDFQIQQLTGATRDVEYVEVRTFGLLFGICAMFIYVMIYCASRRRCSQLSKMVNTDHCAPGQTPVSNALANLKALQRDTLGRIIGSPLVMVAWVTSNVLVLIYGLSGLWHTDHERFDRISRSASMKP